MRAARFAAATLAAALWQVGAAAQSEPDDQTRIARELIEVTQAYVVYKVGNFKAAFPAWMALAEKGNRQGMLNVGNMYLAGEGTAKNAREAFRWYIKAAEAGSSIGMHQVAESYMHERGVARDEAEARRWYEKAAEAGSTEAQRWLGETLTRDGEAEAGKTWLDKAAAQGDMGARDSLAALEAGSVADGARPVSPFAHRRVLALLGHIDDAANARRAALFVEPIEADAAIVVDLPAPGGREQRTIDLEGYKSLWRETFARPGAYNFERTQTELSASGDGVTVRSAIREAFGGDGTTLALNETLLVDLSGAQPKITRVSLVVSAPASLSADEN